MGFPIVLKPRAGAGSIDTRLIRTEEEMWSVLAGLPAATVGVGDSFDLTLTLADPFSAHPGDAITSLGFNVGILDPSVVSYTGFTGPASVRLGTDGRGRRGYRCGHRKVQLQRQRRGE